eukprot:9477859-Pyramimonas_sp.AAC.1
MGPAKACAQPAHRRVIGLCIGCAYVCRGVFEYTRALWPGRAETSANPVHRPIYQPIVGCAQPVDRP